jgi:hypothetical protein
MQSSRITLLCIYIKMHNLQSFSWETNTRAIVNILQNIVEKNFVDTSFAL